MALLLRGLAAGDERGEGVVPLADGEGRLGVGHQGVREPPPGAEPLVEGLAIGRPRLVDTVAVEEREAVEELRLERQRPGVGLGREGGGASGVVERLLVAALPTQGHEERGEAPHGEGAGTGRLGDGEGPARCLLPAVVVTGVGHGPALLGQHRDLLEGLQRRSPVEALPRDLDELADAVLERQRTDEREPDGGVDLGEVRPGEQGLGPLRGLEHPAGTQQRLHDLRRHDVSVRVTARQQRLGLQEQVDRDAGCPRRRIAGSLPQPDDGLEVTVLGPEHEVVCHREPISTRGHQRRCGLAVEEASGGRWCVPVDRVMDQLVAEHDPVVDLIEQLHVEGLAETADDVGRRSVRHRRDVADRHRITERCRDAEQLEGLLRQCVQATDDEVVQ